MRINRNYEERSEYLVLLDELRRSDFIQNSPAGKALLNDKRIDEYFERNIGENKNADAKLEKMIGVAAAKMAAKVTGAKEEDIIKAANEAVEVFRDVRLKKLLQEGRITEAAYILYKKAQKCSFIKAKAKALFKRFGKKPISWILKKALRYIPNPVVQAAVKGWDIAQKVWSLIPQPIKEKVKEKATELARKAIEKIPAVAEKLYDAGKKVVATSAKIIQKGIQTAVETGKVLVEGGKVITTTVCKAGSTLLKGAATVVKTAASCFNTVLSAPARVFASLFS